MGWIKVVIHAHTHYSHDSNRSPAELIRDAEREGIDCIAITDHDLIVGALEARDLSGRVRVIVGEEISTADGHLLGLFLREQIEPGLPVETTIERIHAQGGLAIAPHPFCTLCEDSLMHNVDRVADLLDAVEVHNAQNPLPWQDARAALFARRCDLPAVAGADAHLAGYRTPAYQLMPEFDDPASFLASLRRAQLVLGRFGARYTVQMGLRHVWDLLMPVRLGGYGAGLARLAPQWGAAAPRARHGL